MKSYVHINLLIKYFIKSRISHYFGANFDTYFNIYATSLSVNILEITNPGGKVKFKKIGFY